MKKTLVLGASLNSNRYSYMAVLQLQDMGYEVVGIGLREGKINGVPIYSHLKEFQDIHTVTIYMGAQHQETYQDYILSLQPKRVIFNPGAENPAFCQKLKEQNILAESACTLVLLSTRQY